jgi:lipopolysaccharide/colanic/teichoic acid biosynthesis glycosyltransferase
MHRSTGIIVQPLAESDAAAAHIDLPFTATPAPEATLGRPRPAPVQHHGSAANRFLKRAVDLLAATAVLVVTAPLGLCVALLIKMEDGGPIFFRQRRVGLGGVVFLLSKFRSMRVDAEAETGPIWAQPDDPRVTRVGRWIRLLHVDEIPQAWNVLRGEMSFVGPRPERPEFVGELRSAIPFYDYRHAVRPGITGWAQVNVRHTANVDDVRRKLAYDLDYLRNSSLRMDLTIMLRTLRIIAFGWRSR